MKKEEFLEILEAFEKSSLTQLTFENPDCKIQLSKLVDLQPERESDRESRVADGEKEVEEKALATNSSESVRVSPSSPVAAQEQTSSFNQQVKAPLVGTFYRSASETKKPFVSIGDIVERGQILCVLEAMKMFNEIKSPYAGKIVRIFPNNGDLVEYGQALFEIEETHV